MEHARDSRVGFENGCGHGGDSRREMGATSGLSGGVRPFGRVEADQRLNGRAHSISVSLYLLREKDMAVHSEATKICDDSMKDTGGCEQ